MKKILYLLYCTVLVLFSVLSFFCWIIKLEGRYTYMWLNVVGEAGHTAQRFIGSENHRGFEARRLK
jgi:hypothetical protein